MFNCESTDGLNDCIFGTTVVGLQLARTNLYIVLVRRQNKSMGHFRNSFWWENKLKRKREAGQWRDQLLYFVVIRGGAQLWRILFNTKL